MTYDGPYRRAKQRIAVLRGYPGNESTSFTYSAKPKDGEGILSGMLISLDNNDNWVKGVPAGKTPYFAYHDQTDTDVKSSGLLLGLSCAGNFEIETGYFKSDDTYVTDSPLIAGTTSNVGSVAKGTLTGAADIIGFATRGGRQDTTKTNSEAGTIAGPNYTLTLATKWLPVHS
jgi:hypothetical protein